MVSGNFQLKSVSKKHGFPYVQFFNIRVNNCAGAAHTMSLGRQPNLQLLFYYFDGIEILVFWLSIITSKKQV
jgi:hypothetical protein